VFGNSLASQMLIILIDRIRISDDCDSRSFIDLFQHMIESWFACSITSPAADFVMPNKTTVAVIFSLGGESSCIEHI